jgi:hypothetical protein
VIHPLPSLILLLNWRQEYSCRLRKRPLEPQKFDAVFSVQCTLYSPQLLGGRGWVSNSGTPASNRQNTASPKYKDDISLLISQYLIAGWDQGHSCNATMAVQIRLLIKISFLFTSHYCAFSNFKFKFKYSFPSPTHIHVFVGVKSYYRFCHIGQYLQSVHPWIRAREKI